MVPAWFTCLIPITPFAYRLYAYAQMRTCVHAYTSSHACAHAHTCKCAHT